MSADTCQLSPPRRPVGHSLRLRAAALKHAEIDFIPNASFDRSELANLGTNSAGANSSGANSAGTNSAGAHPGKPIQADGGQHVRLDLPAHLGRLCEARLLTPEDEAQLFRQMNYLKFLATELIASLDCAAPDRQTVETIELLLRQAQEIRDQIIKANMRLVMSIVKKFVTPLQSFDDLLSEGTITLMQAVEKFDYDRGFRFSTYAYRSISRTAYRCVAAANEHEARVTRDAEEWAFGHSDDAQSSTMTDQLWSGLRDFTAAMLQRLDRRERFIIRSRYALGSHRRVRSFQDLANKLGVSKERVRQIESRAVGKLQTMAKEFQLDDVRLSTSP